MRAILLSFVPLFFVACTGEDVVLATIPVSDAGEAPQHDEKCVSDGECPKDKFCDKLGCGTMPGRCHHFPAACDAIRSPVCGCDGITYFNDCLRRAAGTSIALSGECEENARECSEGTCPGGGFCARLVGTGAERCGPELGGRCWILPATCPVGDPDHWDTCGEPKEGEPGLKCADTCAAIRSEQPAFRQTRCN